MGLRNLFKKKTERSNKFKQMEEDLRLQKMLEERQKSSNERELDRFHREARERQIKKELEGFRKKQSDDLWGSHALDKGNILHEDNNILKARNIFTTKGNMLNSESMFF